MSDKPTKAEIAQALEMVTREYMSALLGLMVFDETLKEANHFKTTMTTPDGGRYLIQMQHVDGPRISLEEIRNAPPAPAEPAAGCRSVCDDCTCGKSRT